MAKPPLPTQQEMRDYCRNNYGHYSNISREWIQQGMDDDERIALAGYPDVDRNMAETFEEAWFVLDPADQDSFLDWYITWYLTDRKRYDGRAEGDPNHEDPHYQLGGYVVNQWRAPTVCGCQFQVMGPTPGAGAIVWMRTRTRCTEHSGEGQVLRDTVYNEMVRKSGVLAIITGLIDAETALDLTAFTFSNDRIEGTDERVLELTIATDKPNRDRVASAADVQFGAGAIRVS